MMSFLLGSHHIAHVGSEGDVNAVPLSSLCGEQVDLLCAGPPCPPWAGNGSRASNTDMRSTVFETICKCIVLLESACGLLAVVLENITGILRHLNQCESYGATALRTLQEWLPEWNWEWRRLSLEDYGLPQTAKSVLLDWPSEAGKSKHSASSARLEHEDES